MSIFTSRILACIVAVFLTSAAGSAPVFAQQTKRVSAVVGRDLGCVLVVCGSVVNSAQAADADPATAASISPPLAAGTAALRLGFDTPVPAGARVNMLVSFTGSALSLGLVNNTTISTYAAAGSRPAQTLNLGSLLNLTTLNSDVMNVEFSAAERFQEIELRTGSLVAVNVGYAVQLYHTTATFTPLPVKLTSFTGEAQPTSVALQWGTASEQNSDYFQVERASADAPTQFEAIGRVAAAGTSARPQTYRFIDAAPRPLGYYRLRQVDRDGSSTYSPVVAVAATSTLALQAYPNPSTGHLTITGPPQTAFVLANSLGQVVRRGELVLGQPAELDFSNQPDGLYFLRNQATGTTVKITKSIAGQR